MKNGESIDRIIQINDINIGKNIAGLRKALHIKQTDMVARLQTKGIDIYYSSAKYFILQPRSTFKCGILVEDGLSKKELLQNFANVYLIKYEGEL